ncbi:hypothetical protein P3G55_13135 [Leptospira sp. 96542]|nr:hypothetical protein [Leptospira sp. 96542]
MKNLVTVSLFTFLINCFLPPNNPNTEFTINKRDTEERIKNVTHIKALSCNFEIFQALFLSELGNDEDPSPDRGNKSILFEKRAVNHCLKSILVIPCPHFPPNTRQAMELMIANIFTNRNANCNFQVIRFHKFQKPLNGAFW